MEDGSKYGKGQDSINCIKNLSLYKEFFKHNNYKDAIGPWRKVFSECPASSERMYVEGITMYRKSIESSTIPERTEELIDTMLSAHIQNFLKKTGGNSPAPVIFAGVHIHDVPYAAGRVVV